MSKVADPEQPQQYYGNKTPEHLKDGPVENHGCTDPLCLLLFLAAWAGMIFVAFYSFSNGNPDELIAPYDQFGNPCGVGNQTGFPYVYFTKTSGVIQSNLTVCVSDCPQNSTSQLNCSSDATQAYCNSQTVYPTSTFGNRICLPQDQTDATTLANAGAFDLGAMFKAASDLQSGWWLICCVGVIGVLVGFLYVLFMRYCSSVVTWGILVLYLLGLCIFGGICLLESSQNTFSSDLGTTALSSISPVVLKIIAAFCFLTAFISLIVMFVFRDKIRLGVTVLQAAAQFVEETKTALLLPVFFFLISLIFYIFWVFTFIYLIGTNEVTETQQNSLPFGQVEWSSKASWMFAFMIFGLVWMHAFFHALPQFVISSATCMWYFKDVKVVEHPIATSLVRALQHLGSIAFGSLMIGILDFLKIMVKIFERIFVPSNESNGGCAKCCGACAEGCVSCFDMCLKFIDRHAYVQMAMTGNGFCTSTKEAFYLILRNTVRFGVIHGLGVIFVFMGQIFITVVATLLGYLVLIDSSYFQERLFSPIIMTLFFFLIALIVGHSFMSVYGVAADTIIHCYAMDDELHAHAGGARHAPEFLKAVVNTSTKQRLLADVRGK